MRRNEVKQLYVEVLIVFPAIAFGSDTQHGCANIFNQSKSKLLADQFIKSGVGRPLVGVELLPKTKTDAVIFNQGLTALLLSKTYTCKNYK